MLTPRFPSARDLGHPGLVGGDGEGGISEVVGVDLDVGGGCADDELAEGAACAQGDLMAAGQVEERGDDSADGSDTDNCDTRHGASRETTTDVEGSRKFMQLGPST